ncbi:MAG: hypothetical protein ACREID_03620, partial [Planctomycetota bacterium]
MTTALQPPAAGAAGTRGPRRRPERRSTSLFAHGEPMIWATGGALAICLVMILGLLVLVTWQGTTTFWPVPVVRFETVDGHRFLGEMAVEETYRPGEEVFEALPAEVSGKAREAV